MGRRQFEQPARALAIDAQRLNGVALVDRRAGGAGKVKDPVEARQRWQRLDNVVVQIREPWVFTQSFHVLTPSRNQVVDTGYLVAVSQQPFA
jgi:hypothetical protein